MRALVWLLLGPGLVQAQGQTAKRFVQPTFALPKSFVSSLGAKAWPRAGWPAGMLGAVQKVFSCGRCEAVEAMRVDLGALGTGALLTQKEEQCGQGGNCYSYAIGYEFQGKFRVDAVGGASLAGLIVGEGKVPEVIGVQDIPCCEQIVTRASFRGGRFVESGCDVAEYEDGFGDFRKAHVKACP